MPVGPPFAACPPRTRRHYSCLVGQRRVPKRDTARMAASTQGERLIREPPRNISCKAGFGLFRRKVTAKSSGCGGGWVDHRLHRGDFACRKAADFGVPADDRLATHWMSGPSWRSTSFDFAAAWRSCSRSKVPTFGISRSMMNFCKAMTVPLIAVTQGTRKCRFRSSINRKKHCPAAA